MNTAAWRALRQAKRLSYRQLAAMTGGHASYAHLANVENGRRGVSRTVVEAVALALGVPASALVHENGAPGGAPLGGRERTSQSTGAQRKGAGKVGQP